LDEYLEHSGISIKILDGDRIWFRSLWKISQMGRGFSLQPILKLAPSLMESKGLTVQYMKTSKIIMTLQTQGYAKDIWGLE
jgi:hypothetical protein